MHDDFDLVRDVTVKGCPIPRLTRDELIEALAQALWRIRELEQRNEGAAVRADIKGSSRPFWRDPS